MAADDLVISGNGIDLVVKITPILSSTTWVQKWRGVGGGGGGVGGGE